MTGKQETLLSLAISVADGVEVDWETNALGEDDELRKVVERLRILDQISRLHRATPEVDPAEDFDSLSTIQSPASGAGGTAHETRLTVWGDLELREKVGEGSYGEVFRAWDRKLEREVALKLYWPSQSEPDDEDPRLQEGRLLARLRHPNVVAVLGADHHGGRIGIWVEFVRGRTLEDMLKEREKFGAHEAALAGIEVCRALAAIHGAGLVHGDLKTDNVMREDGGRIVVLDFSAGRDRSRRQQDELEVISGTPLYMAPELLEGSRSSVESDIYGAGVLLHHLVTASYPVVGTSVGELRTSHREGRRTLLRDLRPDLPADFIEIVETAIAPDPDRRFRTAGALEATLRRYLAGEESVEALPVVRFQARYWAMGVAAVAIAAMALAWFVALPTEPPAEPAAASSAANDPAPESVDEPPPPSSTRKPPVESSVAPPVEPRLDAAALVAQANTLHALGRHQEAKELSERALRFVPTQGLVTADRLVMLASTLQALGDYEGAVTSFRRALSIYEEFLGPDAAVYVASASNLGQLERYLGRPASLEGAAPSLSLPQQNESTTLPELIRQLPSTSLSYSIEAALYAVGNAEHRRLLSGSRVGPGDKLFLELRTTSPLHLYILNQDEQGDAFLLFPLPAYALRNPIPANTTVRLPGTHGGEPMFWQVTSAGVKEHLLIVASPHRLEELEGEVRALASASSGRPVLAARLSADVVGQLRGIGGLVKGLAQAGPLASSLFHIAGDLPTHVEFIRGAWIRKLELENPVF